MVTSEAGGQMQRRVWSEMLEVLQEKAGLASL